MSSLRQIRINLLLLFSIIVSGLIAITFYYHVQTIETLAQDEFEQTLSSKGQELAVDVQTLLRQNIEKVQVIGSNQLLTQALRSSNENYAQIGVAARKAQIAEQNEAWKTHNTSPLIESVLTNPVAMYLRDVKSGLPNLMGEIFVTNRFGVAIASTNKLTTFAHQHKYWWQGAYHQGRGQVFIDDRGFDESANAYVLGIVIPLLEQGEVIGLLKANLKLSGLFLDLIARHNEVSAFESIIVRSYGQVVFQENWQSLTRAVPPELLKLLNQKRGSPLLYKLFGESVFVAQNNIQLSDILQFNVEFGGMPVTVDRDATQGNKGEQWLVLTFGAFDKGAALIANTTSYAVSIAIALVFFGLVLGFIGVQLIIHKEQEYQARLQERALKTERDLILKTRENAIQLEVVHKHSKNALLGEMLGSIAHQWRQPLNELSLRLVKFSGQYHQGEMNNALFEDFVKEQNRLIDFMGQTVSDFQNFFRQDKVPQNFALKSAISQVLKLLEGRLNKHRIMVYVTGVNLQVNGYEGEFKQVLINLIANSIDAIKENLVQKPRIDLHLSASGMVFSDNAGGIDEQILSQIFDPYFTTKFTQGGSGLGLYISKLIVEGMGGKIEARNTENGVGFEIHFAQCAVLEAVPDFTPRMAVEAPKPEPIAVQPQVKLQGKTVLVVEDVEVNRTVLLYLLQEMGLSVLQASNGFEALEVIGKNAVDVILMDIEMPAMDGLKATQKIREQLRLSMPIIALTGNSNQETIQKAFAVGMDAYLTKPIDRELLLNQLNTVLSNSGLNKVLMSK
ncbi:hypothetical protein THMIRHAS_04160 [Thiosulfatimonas sediminis]|uniref:histidine kinase n=1 Tax=Thiosulfatimonas sediminis TaxID=2675054 RepID=A0A6F8PSD9_9GAMM|nr:response regulator [Thiosulfatimonas sediminis]BBP45043.1 hypothetical protein THMIRHAS_04160 [Thiosulfatimonas sediminis]